MIARSTLRPIRPQPLIATLTVMSVSLFRRACARPGDLPRVASPAIGATITVAEKISTASA
jgi:hypothetical protein